MNGFYMLLRGNTNIVIMGIYPSLAAFGAVAKPMALAGDKVVFYQTATPLNTHTYTVSLDINLVLTEI